MTDLPAEQPLSRYSEVMRLLISIAAKLGLQIHAYGVVPPEEEGPVVLQASFVRAEPDTTPQALEQAHYDELFNQTIEGFDNGDGLFGT